MTGFPVGYTREADSQSGYKVLGPIHRGGLSVGFSWDVCLGYFDLFEPKNTYRRVLNLTF